MSKRRLIAGFTLVEVLVVIVIVGVLMALLLPAVQMARASARTATCANNERQIGIAFRRYLQQNGRAPKAETLAQGLEAYYAEGQASIYKCPDVSEGTSYGANKFVHQMLDDTFKIILLDAKESPIPFDDETSEEWREKVDPRHSGTFNVLYFDGHVEKQVAFGIDPYVESAKNKWMWEPNRYNKEEDGGCPDVPAVAGGLVAHYTFDEPTAMGLDLSGTGHNASYNPLKVVSVEDQERCHVALFKKDSEAGSGVPLDNFRMSPPVTSAKPIWTVCYWWKYDNTGTSNIFMGFGSFWGSRYHAVGGSTMWLQSGFSEDIIMTQSPSSGQWNHIAGTLSITDRQLRAWINGVPKVEPMDGGHFAMTLQSTVFNGIDSPANTSFGANYGATGHFDDIRIYERALTDAEVLTIYQDGLPK
jgi:prepilin-type processing-associated H-X9-DG protein/prepilin-type N-terminal cleavage/methylation domain-containing protein